MVGWLRNEAVQANDAPGQVMERTACGSSSSHLPWPILHLSQECEAFSLHFAGILELLVWTTRSTARPPQKFIVSAVSGHEDAWAAKASREASGSVPHRHHHHYLLRSSNANLDPTTIAHGAAAIAVPLAVYSHRPICVSVSVSSSISHIHSHIRHRRCVGSQQTSRRFSLQSALPFYYHFLKHHPLFRAPLHPWNHLLRLPLPVNVRVGMLAISAIF